MIVPGILGHYTSLTTHSTPAILRLMVDCHCILRPDTAALAQNLLLLYVVLARLSARLLAGTSGWPPCSPPADPRISPTSTASILRTSRTWRGACAV